MTESALLDQAHRDLALDVSGSYIVQAPAGSGKTELLTLRYLKLLTLCEQPEEVLAITFTRKAASEMRARILKLLRLTASEATAADASPLLRQRHEIAQRVLAKNSELNWRLLENPSRLRVQTIDSFCHYLAGQLPILSRMGGSPEISEDVEPCFIDAIENTLAKLDSQQAIADDIAKLLRHLDNDRNRLLSLLTSLLYKRDQWLSYVLELGSSPDQAQQYLRDNLEELIEETLNMAGQALIPYQHSLLPLLNYALENLASESADSFTPLESWPGTLPDDLPQWLRLTDLLLTQNNDWRKTVNVKSGFPPGKAGETAGDNKAAMLGVLEELSGDDMLLGTLSEIRLLPDALIDSEQWQFLTALLNVLSDLASELQLSFRRFGVIDYPQTSAAALAALGSEEEPTDIALALDHRLQHILIDEFQDTSKVQLALLKQLTAGWQDGDGRTLFLVGDAMQSCYGFRDANVGIYLDVRERGINNVHLTPLTLQANFRSQSKVVDWVNEIFSGAFPAEPDSSRGAVPYSASQAIKPALADYGIQTTLITYGEDEKELARFQEADLIVARIQALRVADPDAEIAILARSRPHFEAIIPRLRSAGIAWQATDIDRLATVPVVSDLLSLTKALVNPADRLAWLSVLRAPWCGLDASALQCLCQLAEDNSIYSGLKHPDLFNRLDAQNGERLHAVLAILDYAMHYRMRLRLNRLVEAAWTLLRGPECCETQVELDCVRRFLQLLGEQESANSLENFSRFEKKLQASYIPASAVQSAASNGEPETQAKVHLLTMHKAKGLEYDHIILPALTLKSGGVDPKSLLLWHERMNEQGTMRLFLGALTATGKDDSRLYAYLKAEKALKEKLESTRLLYIAVTRAIKSASLFGTLAATEPTAKLTADIPAKNPGSDTLLSRIWTQLMTRPDVIEWRQVSQNYTNQGATGEDRYGSSYRRFNSAFKLSVDETRVIAQRPESINPHQEAEADAPVPLASFNVQGDRLASLLGTLIHEALELYTKTEQQQDMSTVIARLDGYWRTALRRLLLSDEQISRHMQTMSETLQNCTSHPDYGWLFDNRQQDNQSELSLISKRSGRIREHKIDRTLIDQHGIRWIVDYKTAHPGPGQNEEDFIAQQLAEYAGQLERYRGLFSDLEERPVKTALFFTAIPRLVEHCAADDMET